MIVIDIVTAALDLRVNTELASECDVGLAAAQLVGRVAGVVGEVLPLHPTNYQRVPATAALHVSGNKHDNIATLGKMKISF